MRLTVPTGLGRSLMFTANGNSFLTAQALSDLEANLGPLERGYPNGKLEQFLIEQLNDEDT